MFNHLIGLSLQEAREKLEQESKRLRVMQEDGKSRIGTCDLRRDRVNVSVNDGKITDILSVG